VPCRLPCPRRPGCDRLGNCRSGCDRPGSGGHQSPSSAPRTGRRAGCFFSIRFRAGDALAIGGDPARDDLLAPIPAAVALCLRAKRMIKSPRLGAAAAIGSPARYRETSCDASAALEFEERRLRSLLRYVQTIFRHVTIERPVEVPDRREQALTAALPPQTGKTLVLRHRSHSANRNSAVSTLTTATRAVCQQAGR